MNEQGPILVVDDDRDLRETIEEILSPEGFNVVCCGSADSALALIQDTPFALILLDMIMPGTDGMTAINLIRKVSPRVRIVVITAYASIPNAVEAMRRGANDYLVKPFSIETLLTTVRRNLAEAELDNHQCADIDAVFQGLANMLRRQIITTLQQRGDCRFMELVRALAVEDHTKVNFHLKTLREAGFVSQRQNKSYYLTPAGLRAANCLNMINKGV
ncbi:response regulator [Desulfurivibrio alkaliphilus]|uniref:Response regulator receiver protein n=1 Tax=Desulfurivibrio alkaliphilus (strain DSM 19089 / UNIQEM U267 / AHT2) TaxID=589865 RepID=D6Z5N3_DESAT|nr:response regulator [Desulfurivibrio alkaliphilus]ADH86770.1 response regulator receiver protein [Desulfurivibrio alkaliphilus AHT 2]